MPALTSLRFFAAAFVVALHLSYWYGWTGPPAAVARNGYTGVTFFFILSGFVLTMTQRPGLPARTFYRRRFARVYPLHAITWLVALTVWGASAWEFSAGLMLIQAWDPQHAALNTVAWSLSCEAFFYALFPLLVVAVHRANRVTCLRGLAVCWLVTAGGAGLLFATLPFTLAGTLTYHFPLFRLPEFIAGMLLAQLIRQGWTVPRWAAVTAAVPAAALVAVEVPAHVIGALATAPAFAILVCYGASSRRGLLHHRAFVALGQQSYALYLTHVLVYIALGATFGIGATVTAAAMLAVAAAAHLRVERPLERLLRGRQVAPSTIAARCSPASGAAPR